MKKTNRLETIDTIRGLTIISMILYHFCWDLKYIEGLHMPWYGTFGSYLWQQSICWSFILISGFCMHFARKPVRNGILVSICGFIVTMVTLIALPDSPVYFGVLTMLGSSMILLGAFLLVMKMAGIYPREDKPYGEKSLELDKAGYCLQVSELNEGQKKLQTNAKDAESQNGNIQKILAVVTFFLFLITKPINSGFLRLGFTNLKLPAAWFENGGPDGMNNSFLTFLGIMQKGFYSSDYFSLIPWFFLFVTGYFLFYLVKEAFENTAFHIDIKLLSWIGRHSLIIYMLHQPVLYAITVII